MVSVSSTDLLQLCLHRPTPDGIREDIRIGFYQFPKAVSVYSGIAFGVYKYPYMARIQKDKNWNWKDIRYIDPDTEVTCSGGLDGKPKHDPTHMVMGINDVVLVCPICDAIYGNEERMNSVGVQAQMAEAERRKQLNNNTSLLKVDPSQRINKK